MYASLISVRKYNSVILDYRSIRRMDRLSSSVTVYRGAVILPNIIIEGQIYNLRAAGHSRRGGPSE
jgi:hypothetical protein